MFLKSFSQTLRLTNRGILSCSKSIKMFQSGVSIVDYEQVNLPNIFKRLLLNCVRVSILSHGLRSYLFYRLRISLQWKVQVNGQLKAFFGTRVRYFIE